MLIAKNPTPEKIRELANLSPHKAAKWIKDDQDGATYYWPADDTQHVEIARALHVKTFKKGIAIASPETAP